MAATTASTAATHLGVVRDSLGVGGHAVTFGFGIARFATDAGFGIASACIRGPATVLEQAAGPNLLSSTLHGVNSAVGVAHWATTAGQDVAQAITHASLGATRAGLAAAGAEEGALLKLTVGEEAAEAVTAIEAMVRNFATPMANVAPLPRLLAAASAWGALQRAAGRAAPAGEPAQLPELTERWLRFTAATFGHTWLAGLLDGLTPAALARAHAARASGSPGEQAVACAGIEGRVEVLDFEQSTRELFAPGFLVAVDHETGRVVIALRGTSCIADALADLICEPVGLRLGGQAGQAHGGMLRAATRLEGLLARLAEEGLSRLDASRPKQIVICGHSLGAGVASLVAALWRDARRFAGTPVECFAFACPQVLDADLAFAQSNHTMSFIVQDDLVPRLSLATSQDLRSAMIALADPARAGLDAALTPEQVTLSEVAGEREALAAAYVAIRPMARTETGRLFPPGRLVHLRDGSPPLFVAQEAVDELLISSDMAAAHMPRRYLLAIQAASTAQSRM